MFLNCALVSVSDHFDGLSNIEIGVEYLLCLTTFVLKNLRRLFDKYAVACTEHGALVKSTTKIFPNFVAFSENPNFTKTDWILDVKYINFQMPSNFF